MPNKHRISILSTEGSSFTGSIYKVCPIGSSSISLLLGEAVGSAIASFSIINNLLFGTYDFNYKDTYGDSVDASSSMAWTGSVYLKHDGDIVLNSGCIETDMIALKAKQNSVMVYHRIA